MSQGVNRILRRGRITCRNVLYYFRGLRAFGHFFCNICRRNCRTWTAASDFSQSFRNFVGADQDLADVEEPRLNVDGVGLLAVAWWNAAHIILEVLAIFLHGARFV